MEPLQLAMPTLLQRALRNAARCPARTLRTVRRRFDPVYRLEREAVRQVPRRFGQQRCLDVASIPGTSSTREGMLLAHLAMQSPAKGVIVEIGAFKGRTTAWLVEAAGHHPARPAVVSIDPHLGMGHWHPASTWDEFQQTVERFGLQARGLEVRRAMSAQVAPSWLRPISFLWIDGSHDYQDVAGDIDGFVPHVLPGGWVVFDDAAAGDFPDVWQAIQDRMLPRTSFAYLGLLRHLAIFRRAV
jgi:predicted O-methyltransferase YrrM